ncbi:MAG: ATP-binding cassette domain-containing protein [Candidatus Solibacter usitatus]|nr:ATP-binding cassette domain-containing protein [Candidatus Solibacter usitatus]
MADSAIELSDVTIAYGARVVISEFSLKVPCGRVYGFVGPNGAGKTSTIRTILGLKRARHGEVRVLNHDVTRDRSVLRRVGSLIDPPSLYPHLSGAENVSVFAHYYRVSASDPACLLDTVGLAHAGKMRVREYSQGMKQRLGVALALVPQPDLVILDEPMNGLDPIGIAEFRDMVLGLSRRGKTVFLSSHLLDEVSRMATDVALISRGRLVYAGSMNGLTRTVSVCLIEASPRELAVYVLRSVGCEVSVAGEKLAVNTEVWSPSEISQLLASRGVVLNALIPDVQESLEDVFLRLTKGDPV